MPNLLSRFAGLTDATALQHHIKNGKTAYIASGKVTGNAYTPAMMKYNGSTGYFSKSITHASATGYTFLGKFIRDAFTGGSTEYIAEHVVTSGPFGAGLILNSNDHATTGRRQKLQLFVTDNAGALKCRIFSTIAVTDGLSHTIFVSYNASAGTAVMRVDGVDVLDTGNAQHILTTGTLPNGAGTFTVGATSAAVTLFAGNLGFFGFRAVSLTNWSDFMRSDGSPIAQAESGSWGGWGAQPLFWNEHGQMDNNLGSAGNMTRNGTIVVGKGGNT